MKIKKISFILGLLCMAATLLPTTAQAQAPSDFPLVLLSGGLYRDYSGTSSIAQNQSIPEFGNGSYSWDNTTSTLTLTNVNFTTTSTEGALHLDRHGVKAINLVLIGTNSLSVSAPHFSGLPGIYFGSDGTITISGDNSSSLSVTADNTGTNNAIGIFSNVVFGSDFAGSLTVNAISTAQEAAGIDGKTTVNGGSLSISADGVTAKGTSGNVDISGGTLRVRATSSNSSSGTAQGLGGDIQSFTGGTIEIAASGGLTNRVSINTIIWNIPPIAYSYAYGASANNLKANGTHRAGSQTNWEGAAYLKLQQAVVTVTSNHTMTIGDDVLPTPRISYSGLAAGDNETVVFSTLPTARILLPNGYTGRGTYTIEVIPGETKPDAGYIVNYVDGLLTVIPPEYLRMIVTETEGVTTNPGVGEHQVKYGDDFTISFAAKDGYSLHGMKFLANSMEQPVTVSEDGKTATATIAMPLADMLLRVELAEDMPGEVGNHLPPTLSQGGGDLIVSTTTSGVTVSGLHVGTMLYVYTMTGRLVYQTTVDNSQLSILNTQLPRGAYISANDNGRVKAVR
jgi:hypothetical protein